MRFGLLLLLIPMAACQKGTNTSNGKSLYFYAPDGASSVAQYSIGGDGSLTPLSPSSVLTGNSPRSVSATSQYAYIANYADDSISEFEIVDGLLTPLTPPSVSGVSSPFMSVLSPDGLYLYVLNAQPSGSISQFSVGGDGQLNPLAVSSVGMSPQPNALAFTPSGLFAYACTNTLIYEFSVSGGALNLISTINLSSSCGAMAASLSGYVYVGLSTNSILQFSIGTSGMLTALNPASVAGTGSGTDTLVTTPNGNFLYAGNFNTGSAGGPISQYSIGSNGTLTALSPLSVTAGSGPYALLISADGSSLYCANNVDGTIQQFSVHPSGQLTTNSTITVGRAAYYPAIVGN